RGQGLVEGLGQSRLVERDPPVDQGLDLRGVDVDAQDLVPQGGHAHGMGGPEISGADHGEPGRPTAGVGIGVHGVVLRRVRHVGEGHGCGVSFHDASVSSVHSVFVSSLSASSTSLLHSTTLSRLGVSANPWSPSTSSAVLCRKMFPVPQPSRISWVWNPSAGEVVPMFPSMSQSLPFTSTHESAKSSPSIPEPSKVLFRMIPPVVPSLTSMASAVTSSMRLSSMRFSSEVSGSPPVRSSQLLSAEPM